MEKVPESNQYAIPEDGQQYRITEVQHTLNDAGLKISLLTLERMQKNYELERDMEDIRGAQESNG